CLSNSCRCRHSALTVRPESAALHRSETRAGLHVITGYAPRNPPRYGYLQELLLAREVVRDRGFGGEQADAGEQQVPPEALALLRFFARHLLRLLGLDAQRRGVAGHRRNELARIDRAQVRLGGVEVQDRKS